MDDQTFHRITLDVIPGSVPVEGWAVVGDSERRPFVGMLELLGLIGRASASDEPGHVRAEHDSTGPRRD